MTGGFLHWYEKPQHIAENMNLARKCVQQFIYRQLLIKKTS